VRSELLALLYFAHLMPPARIAAVLDGQLAQMREGLVRMKRTGCPGEHEWPGSVRFVQGFGIALHEAAVRYMAANRHLLESPPSRAAPARRAAAAPSSSTPARRSAAKSRRRAA
jgi:hypothetical protein